MSISDTYTILVGRIKMNYKLAHNNAVNLTSFAEKIKKLINFLLISDKNKFKVNVRVNLGILSIILINI